MMELREDGKTFLRFFTGMNVYEFATNYAYFYGKIQSRIRIHESDDPTGSGSATLPTTCPQAGTVPISPICFMFPGLSQFHELFVTLAFSHCLQTLLILNWFIKV
jgi:hypothetical protein